jgi:hypothetical protein
MSTEKQQSGCIGGFVKLFIAFFVIVFIAGLILPRSESDEKAILENQSLAEPPISIEKHSTSISKDIGYNDGFIVGQARHNDKMAGLDPVRIELLSRINSESHIESGGGRSAADYQDGWKKGYADGFLGKARGGKMQKSLPRLPIIISREPKYLHENLSNTEASVYLDQLALLVSEGGDKDLFVVDAKVVLNENSTELVRVLYDRDEKLYFQLTRLILSGEESDAEWILKTNIGEDELNEDKLWETDTNHHTFRSKFNEAKTSVPLIYLRNRELTDWP